MKYFTQDGCLCRAIIKPNPLVPMTESGTLTLGDGMYMLQNVGETAVMIGSDHRWTIAPGGTLSIGSSSDWTKSELSWKITFLTTIICEGKIHSGNRLEIMELITCIEKCR